MTKQRYLGEAQRRSAEVRQQHSNKKGYAAGGRVKAYPIDDGAGSGPGRLEKIGAYGKNVKTK